MGIHYSPLLVNRLVSIGSTYDQGEVFVRAIKDAARTAGWIRTKIAAHIQFTAFAIADANTITLAGNTFTFYSTTPSGPNPVFRGSNNLDAITNLGPVVYSILGWTYVIAGTVGNPNITWTVIDVPSDDDFTGNLISCSAAPAGGIGLFDNNAENIAGRGQTWGGGYTLTSATVLGNGALVLKITTAAFINLSFRCPIDFKTANGIGSFDGLAVPGGWTLLFSKYQMILYKVGIVSAGSFLIASHMYPARTLTYANYINGPENPVSTTGGARANLQSIGHRYYVDVGSPYQTGTTSTVNTNPALCMPGYGTGVTPTQKLSNRLAGLDIKKDDGKGYPYEAFVAACVDSSLTQLFILGQLWDSLIYSCHAAADSVVDIGGGAGIVLFSQVGATANSRGALATLTETHV